MRKNILIGIVLLFILTLETSCAIDWKWEHPNNLSVYLPYVYKDTDYMKYAFNEWTKVTGGRIKFHYIDNPDNANIRIIFVKQMFNGCTDNNAIGCTIYGNGYQYSKNPNIVYYKHIKIYVAMRTNNLKNSQTIELNDNTRYTTMIHEVGHAIGLIEHSQDKASILYPINDEKQKITQGDVDRLKKIYGW